MYLDRHIIFVPVGSAAREVPATRALTQDGLLMSVESIYKMTFVESLFTLSCLPLLSLNASDDAAAGVFFLRDYRPFVNQCKRAHASVKYPTGYSLQNQ